VATSHGGPSGRDGVLLASCERKPCWVVGVWTLHFMGIFLFFPFFSFFYDVVLMLLYWINLIFVSAYRLYNLDYNIYNCLDNQII
jgi:NO-binding membrane sensor protein with MHYT domain